MSKFPAFIELLVKQTCRRASHEHDMNSTKKPAKKNAGSGHPKTGLYSADYLRLLHDKTRENLYTLIMTPTCILDAKGAKPPVGLGFLNSNAFGQLARQFLLEFLENVRRLSPGKANKWIDLQHYMQYVYRNFASPNPDPSGETLSAFFLAEIRELVKNLIEEDETQLYLRIVALLREYCIFAQWNYSKGGDHAITKLFYYYEAMLSAAKNCSVAFQELEVIIYKNYSVCWIDFNTSIFIRYFFETDYVQLKIYQCLEFKESPGDSPAMFGLLEDLKNLWVKEQKRLLKINKQASVDDSTDFYYIEEAMINCHKKVLKCNFWVQRCSQELEDLDLRRLDHHIFRLLFDPLFHPAGPILDKHGQCICEECLIAKYKIFMNMTPEAVTERIIKNIQRVTYCRRCEILVDLDQFQKHINDHSVLDDDSDDSLDTILRKEAAVEELKSKETPANLKDACEIHFKHFDDDKKNEMETTMEAFEEYLRQRKEGGKCEQIMTKNVRNFIKIKKDIFNHTNGQLTDKVFDMLKNSTHTSHLKKKLEQDPKLKNLTKNGHKCEKPYPLSCKTANKANCEHNCKREVQSKTGTCQGHGGTCGHPKDNKNCDCTYCESVKSNTHKNNELRDRLRIRLHQRREKRTKENCKNPPNAVNNANSIKLKTVISKVEERVPLPSSPTNIPPAPVVKSSESSTSSGTTDDIHGLVNYIEGNSALNKMELAQKKAAKKARQRMKKEEDRLKAEEEQKRLAEELAKKEADRLKELARKKAEKEKSGQTHATGHHKQAKSSKGTKKYSTEEVKRKSKKEKLIEKKQQERAAKKANQPRAKIVEETIPAMVTIKRIAADAGDDNHAPTVTITLKGSTPDQDKLLYTLVSGPEEKDSECGKENDKNAGKKKKKQKQKNPNIVTKELKVTVALDQNKKPVEDPNIKKLNKNNHVKYVPMKIPPHKQKEIARKEALNELPMPMLRLPPGITITKVEGPVSHRNYPIGNMEDKKESSVNVAKSGVIVVDTEKLIFEKQSNDSTSKVNKSSKKSKKKKNKKQTENNSTEPVTKSDDKKMITLKNPIFQSFQPKPDPTPVDKNSDNCAPASIFTNENGMVTIRSSRLQQSLMNGGGVPLNPMPLPNLLPEMQTPKINLPSRPLVEEKNDVISPFNAQELLLGLPGIEITKVDKKAVKTESEIKSCQTAQVSIIPTSNGGDPFNFDKDDWFYDSVFSPREVLEDDISAEELELEAFKRFCQQSVPPPQKEKVAHLNVAELMFKKNTDYSYF